MMLMIRMPKTFLKDNSLPKMLAMSDRTEALPLVAFPPMVLPETLASPETAPIRTLLLIVPLALLFRLRLLVLLPLALLVEPGPVLLLLTTAFEVKSPPVEPPPPRFMIWPTQCPMSLMITRTALSPKILVLKRLKRLLLVCAAPVVALPASVLPEVLAAPLWAAA